MKLAEDLRRAVLQAGIEGRLTGSDTGALKWVKLWEVCDKIFAGGDKPEHFSKVKSEIYSVPVIANGVTNEGILGYTDCAKVTEEAVTVSGRGTIGYAKLRNYSFYPIVRLLVLVPSTRLYTKYLEYALNYLSLNGAGTSVQQLTVPMLRTKLIPLPPLEEQHRIVSRLDSILPLIAELEAAENELEDLKRKFPGDMRDSLLQAAIQGKLTGGNQEGWRWVRLGDISLSVQYGYNAPAREKGSVRMIRISDIQNNNIQWASVPYCEISENEMQKYLLAKNDILFARTGGTVGKSYLVGNMPEKAIYAGYLIRMRLSDEVNPQYVKYFMKSESYWKQLRNGTTATAQPNCNGKKLSQMIIPLPPLEEQKQIVSRLNELLPLCEALEKIN